MRIIGGSAKGTKLGSLKGLSIRPTLDRVRESFFNQISADIRGAGFLDLFAGSGAVGIEALSRGAEQVVFVEKNSGAYRLILKNLEKCRFGNEEQADKLWDLKNVSAQAAISSLVKSGNQFDIVYVDPPFADDLYSQVLLSLSESNILNVSSQVVVEHDRKTDLEESYAKLSLVKSRRMGDSCLSFYSPK